MWVSYGKVTSRMPAQVGVVNDAFLTGEPTGQLHFKEEKKIEQGKRLEDRMKWSSWDDNDYTMFNFFLIFFSLLDLLLHNKNTWF